MKVWYSAYLYDHMGSPKLFKCLLLQWSLWCPYFKIFEHIVQSHSKTCLFGVHSCLHNPYHILFKYADCALACSSVWFQILPTLLFEKDRVPLMWFTKSRFKNIWLICCLKNNKRQGHMGHYKGFILPSDESRCNEWSVTEKGFVGL